MLPLGVNVYINHRKGIFLKEILSTAGC